MLPSSYLPLVLELRNPLRHPPPSPSISPSTSIHSIHSIHYFHYIPRSPLDKHLQRRPLHSPSWPALYTMETAS